MKMFAYSYRLSLLIFPQERRVIEDRLKMQKDFEEEQEKNRKKEEEVMGIFSYLK